MEERMKVSTGDEDLIRSRLRTHTTTARPGADAPVKKLLKRYFAFCDALSASGEEDKSTVMNIQKAVLFRQVVVYEFAMTLTASVVYASTREIDAYRVDRDVVLASIATAKGDIEALKYALDWARLDRQHKEEYEALRRETFEEANGTLRGAIGALEEVSEFTTRVLDLRKKQFSTLLHVANELTDDLEYEDEEGERGKGVAVVRAEEHRHRMT
jgi:THO complex subunit 7